MQKRTGGCLCGAVRFEVKGDPEMLHACHCRNCQLMTGSAFAICLYFPEQDITITSGDLTTLFDPVIQAAQLIYIFAKPGVYFCLGTGCVRREKRIGRWKL